jgi:hypothetical protein
MESSGKPVRQIAKANGASGEIPVDRRARESSFLSGDAKTLPQARHPCTPREPAGTRFPACGRMWEPIPCLRLTTPHKFPVPFFREFRVIF